VFVELFEDDSVASVGVEWSYRVFLEPFTSAEGSNPTPSTTAVCPTHQDEICAGHGECAGSKCECFADWTGEDCSDPVLHPAARALIEGDDPDLDPLDAVVFVAPWGNDETGTGQMGNRTWRGALVDTVGKPLKTITAALQYSGWGVGRRVILLAPGVYDDALDCSSDVSDFSNLHVQLVSAHGSMNTRVDCQHTRRFLDVANGRTLLQGLTIVNGYHASEGGALKLASGNHTLVDVEIFDCHSGGVGGAIHAQNVHLYTQDVTIHDCTVPRSTNASESNGYGGAMMLKDSAIRAVASAGERLVSAIAYGDRRVEGGVGVSLVCACVVSGEASVSCPSFSLSHTWQLSEAAEPVLVVTQCHAAYGGGVWLDGVIQVEDTLVHNCSSFHGGNVLVHAGAHVTLDRVTISQGVALGDSETLGGGCVALDEGAFLGGSGTTVVKECVSMVRGGGVFVTKASMDSVHITNCKAPSGGGIVVQSDGVVANVSNVVVQNCTASVAGGGILVSQNSLFSLSHSLIEDCSVEAGFNRGSGGGLYANDTEGSVDDVVISHCTAEEGGCLTLRNTPLHSIALQLTHCVAIAQGGGVHLEQSSLSGDWRLDGAWSEEADGGGVLVTGTSELRNGVITNAHSPVRGGAIFVKPNSPFVMEDMDISHCHAASTGGGLFVDSSDVEATLTTVADCSATHAGGGIAVHAGSVRGVSISHCTAASGGGAWVSQSTVEYVSIRDSNATTGRGGGWVLAQSSTLDHVLVNGSAAALGGGCGYVPPEASVDLLNSTCTSCTALTGAGGGLLISGSLRSTASTVADCRVLTGDGGCLSVTGSLANAALSECELSECHASGDGGGIAALDHGIAVASHTHIVRCVSDNSGGAGIARTSASLTLHDCEVEWCSSLIGGAVSGLDTGSAMVVR
jgi:hypothetical protein